METSQTLIKATRPTLIVLLVVVSLLNCTGCVSMLRYDGPYKGRVVDAESGKPIEGAVAHGTWSKVYPNPAGSSSEYYDSHETLTDKNGDFKIPGQGLLIFSAIDYMQLTIFKAGYEQLRPSDWIGLVQFGPFNKVSWDENGYGTFKLRKLSMEERKKRGVTMPSTPHDKQRLLRIESNKENIEIGRAESTLYKVD